MPPPKDKEPRARRTVKACVICHKKKIRCDIDEVRGELCTPCQRDGYECVPRERKRKRFTFSPSPPATQRRVKAQNTEPSLTESGQSTFLTMDPTEDSTVSGGTGPFGAVGLAISQNQNLKSESELGGRRISSTASLHEPSPLLERHPDPGYPTPHQSIPSNMTGTSYQSSNSVSYLGRLEYLRNDVPVNDDAGLPGKMPHRLSESDVEILRVQRVSELPPRAIRESLMDAFWTRCYPWSPVVERSWIEDRNPNQVSLLLQHAIFLAGSRVSTPLQNYSSENFYKKARILFWMGVEEDPIINIAAACLLHWYNPEGPERVSLDTSSFWLRVCIGLAYQVGLHREPTGKADAGLRRRIWWSLAVRDCLINAGHGRPRAIDLKLADVSPISVLDFEGAAASADLFSSYVGISCILGDLTQSYLRKHGLQEHKKSLEDRLFRWLKTLPEHLQLCRATEERPLKPYNFEARQIHVQYFTVLVILNRPRDPKLASTASLLASSYVAGIFEDFMARDELRYLGPIFTFYCLTAGMAQLSCYRYSEMVDLAEENLAIMARALKELSRRWPSAVGSLKHLMDVREKVTQRPHLGQFPDSNFPDSTVQFFADFGPNLCRMWHSVHQRLPQMTPIAPRELEMAGILQGLRTPNNQPLDMDLAANAAAQQQQMMNSQVTSGATLEPTLLQPQEWFEPCGVGNWLLVDWDQGMGW
ncbi:Nn.00g063000.m01.CDS01 [Neocucurbitaria sp. VM-36]